MLGNRRELEKTGRLIPQVNEEYGYEATWFNPRTGGVDAIDILA